MAEQQAQQDSPMMETEQTSAPESPMVVEANGGEASGATASAEQQEPTAGAAAEEEKKQEEVLVMGLDFGTQKCVLAVTGSAEMFPAIIRNNLANPITPYAHVFISSFYFRFFYLFN